MEDHQIVDLYWARSENAIKESDKKYGRMLIGISLGLLGVFEDAEECVSDTYLAAWSRMPDERPAYLGAFLSKITRRISIDRYRAQSAAGRRSADGSACIKQTAEPMRSRTAAAAPPRRIARTQSPTALSRAAGELWARMDRAFMAVPPVQ